VKTLMATSWYGNSGIPLPLVEADVVAVEAEVVLLVRTVEVDEVVVATAWNGEMGPITVLLPCVAIVAAGCRTSQHQEHIPGFLMKLLGL
jgi:hypothetical protein